MKGKDSLYNKLLSNDTIFHEVLAYGSHTLMDPKDRISIIFKATEALKDTKEQRLQKSKDRGDDYLLTRRMNDAIVKRLLNGGIKYSSAAFTRATADEKSRGILATDKYNPMIAVIDPIALRRLDKKSSTDKQPKENEIRESPTYYIVFADKQLTDDMKDNAMFFQYGKDENGKSAEKADKEEVSVAKSIIEKNSGELKLPNAFAKNIANSIKHYMGDYASTVFNYLKKARYLRIWKMSDYNKNYNGLSLFKHCIIEVN